MYDDFNVLCNNSIRKNSKNPSHVDVDIEVDVIWFIEHIIYSLQPNPAAQLQIPPTGS